MYSFPILKRKARGKRLVYLDNAATTQKPMQVIKATTKFYSTYNANVHRFAHYLGEQATELYNLTREKTASYINAQLQEIIFTSGATESLNLIALSLENLIEENSTILLTEMEHHAIIVPWQEVAKRKKAKLEYVKITQSGKLDLKDLQEKLKKNTSILAFTHVSNVLGTINPVKEICALARDQGVITIVDGTQAIAHMPVNVKDLNCDFYVFSGHKMYGPTGVGVLYAKRELLESLPPAKYGGEMIREVTFEKSTWNDLPYKFEAGTLNIAGIIALSAAIDFLRQLNWKLEKKKKEEITTYILKELNALPQVTLYGPQENNKRIALFAFAVKNTHSHDVAFELDKKGIAVRAGHHCAMPLHSILGVNSTTRASFATYNTLKDARILINSLKEIINTKNRTKQEEKENTQLKENSENALYYYSNAIHKRKLENYTHTRHEKNQICGDEFTFYLQISKGAIRKVSFYGNGCVLSQATAEMLSQKLTNSKVKQVEKITLEEIEKDLGVKLGVVRAKCALLPLKIITKALEGKK